MEFLVDTADLNEIRDAAEHLPLAGVTCNPTIVRKSAPRDFFAHMRQVREIIGTERTLHIQIIAEDAAGQLAEADRLFQEIDPEVHIKVPVTWEGLKTIQTLKKDGHHVTATAVYDLMQAYMALAAGADYITPYVNRIGSCGADPYALIRNLSGRIDHDGYACKIVAASFHSVQQVRDSLDAGAQAVTVSPALLKGVYANPNITHAVADFAADWHAVYGEGKGITNL